MNAERVAILYSRAHHFPKAVAAVQRDFPETDAVALLPPSAPQSVRDALPEDVVQLQTPGGAASTLRFLREHEFDALVVLFPSPRLRLLAAMSRARQRWVCGPDGRLLHMDETPIGVIRDRAAKRLAGTLLYLRLWFATRSRKVKR